MGYIFAGMGNLADKAKVFFHIRTKQTSRENIVGERICA